MLTQESEPKDTTKKPKEEEFLQIIRKYRQQFKMKVVYF